MIDPTIDRDEMNGWPFDTLEVKPHTHPELLEATTGLGHKSGKDGKGREDVKVHP